MLPCGNQHHCVAVCLRKIVLKDSLLAEDLACDQITPFAMRDWGVIPLCPVKARYKLASPCSLLSAGKARKIGAKEFPVEIPEPEAATPKIADSTTLKALKRGHHRHGRCGWHRCCRHHCQQNNNAQQPTATEDQ